MNIYETAIYCGRSKVWRVLNLSTGTIYSADFESKEEAEASIEDGKERSGRVVKRISIFDLVVPSHGVPSRGAP